MHRSHAHARLVESVLNAVVQLLAAAAVVAVGASTNLGTTPKEAGDRGQAKPTRIQQANTRAGTHVMVQPRLRRPLRPGLRTVQHHVSGGQSNQIHAFVCFSRSRTYSYLRNEKAFAESAETENKNRGCVRTEGPHGAY